MAGSKRQLASVLDTALLVFVVLVLGAVGWWLVKSVLGTVLFFAKLAVLALVVALAVRAVLWVRSRSRRASRPTGV